MSKSDDNASTATTKSTHTLPPSTIADPAPEKAALDRGVELEAGVAVEKVPASEEERPLEGRQAWIMVCGGWLGLFATFGFTNGYGAYQTYYETVAYPTAPSATISLVGGLQVASLYIGGLVSGRCVDLFGPKPVIATGTVMCTFALMMLSLTTQIWQVFLTQGLLYGLGMSAVFFPSISMPASWFSKNRAFAIGMVTGGSSIGGVLWPIMLDRLVAEVGFAWMTRISGFIILLCCGGATLLLEPRVPPKAGSIIPDFSQLKKPAFTVLLLSNMIGYFGLFGVIFFIQSRAVSLGVSPSLTPYVLPILNSVSFLGRILPGLVADRIGSMNTWALANMLSLIFILCAWVPTSDTIGVIFTAALYGFSSGAWVSVLPACVPKVAGPQNVASSMGLFYFMSWPGGLAGAALGGLFIHPDAVDSAKGYRAAGYFWGGCIAVGTALVICSRLLHDRRIWATV